MGIRTGDGLRAALLTQHDLSPQDLASMTGRVRVVSIVPSLDTKVCEQQTHYLSERSNGLAQQATLVTVSIDTPFAQQRFAREAKIDNVLFLSDYRDAQFGRSHGLLLEEPHLLTRAVLVVDQHNIIRHLQITPKLGQLPDLDEAFRVARTLLTDSGSR